MKKNDKNLRIDAPKKIPLKINSSMHKLITFYPQIFI